MPQKLNISPFQQNVLRVPEAFDLFLGGGRGGAKTATLVFLALRCVEQYGAKARVLYLRLTHKGCADFVSLCFDLLGPIYGTAPRFNGQEGLFRFPTGGTLEVNQLESRSGSQKNKSRSFTLLLTYHAGAAARRDRSDAPPQQQRAPR